MVKLKYTDWDNLKYEIAYNFKPENEVERKQITEAGYQKAIQEHTL